MPKIKIINHKSKISRARWKAVRLFAMDVDGILTDGTVEISSDGSETKRFSILDGMGLIRCHRIGVIIAWISGRPSEATLKRAAELRIPHVIQGRTDKKTVLTELLARLNLSAAECVYMGDDDIDAPAIHFAGIGVTVPAAMPAALAAANYITIRPGGQGAVREICEHIFTSRGLNFIDS